MEIIVNQKKAAFRQHNAEGSECTVLFLHGAGMSGTSMEIFMEDFKDLNCIALDFPGHGGSEGNGRKSIEEYTDFVQDVLREFHKNRIIGEKVLVAGYSMGGCVALELVLRHAEYVAGIAVLDSGAGLPGKTPLLEEASKFTPETINIIEIFSNCFGTNTTPEFREFMISFFQSEKPSNEICYNDLATAQKYDKLELCADILLPVLILCGAEDKIIPLQCSLELWGSIPNCILGVMPYLGHSGIFENRAFVTGAIRDFINNSSLFHNTLADRSTSFI